MDDSNLANPNNAVRRVLLQTTGQYGNLLPGSAGDYLLVPIGVIPEGAGSTSAPPLWVPDVGLGGQPPDFQVAGKTAYGRIRFTVGFNTVASGAVVMGRLYQITGIGGSGGYTLNFAAVPGAQTNTATATSVTVGLESPQFVLPTGTAGTAYALGVNLSAQPAANSSVIVTAQLLGYNA